MIDKNRLPVVVSVLAMFGSMTMGYAATFTFEFDNGGVALGAPGATVYLGGSVTWDGSAGTVKYEDLDWAYSGIATANYVGGDIAIGSQTIHVDKLLSFAIADTAAQGTYPVGKDFSNDLSLYVNTSQHAESFQLTVVPEPHKYGLMAVAGLIGFAVYDRRTRKQVTA